MCGKDESGTQGWLYGGGIRKVCRRARLCSSRISSVSLGMEIDDALRWDCGCLIEKERVWCCAMQVSYFPKK